MLKNKINYKDVFSLAESKGYKFHFEWDNPFYRTYKHLDDWKAIDESIIETNPEKAFCELTLIQKWLRDKHKLFVEVSTEFTSGVWDIRKGKYERYATEGARHFPSYESALLSGINEALKLI